MPVKLRKCYSYFMTYDDIFKTSRLENIETELRGIALDIRRIESKIKDLSKSIPKSKRQIIVWLLVSVEEIYGVEGVDGIFSGDTCWTGR